MKTLSKCFLTLALAAIAVLAGCRGNQYALTKGPYGVTKLGHDSLDGSVAPLDREMQGADDLWVISRGDNPSVQSANDQPGSGTLLARVRNQEIPMPLKHTDVHASVSCFI